MLEIHTTKVLRELASLEDGALPDDDLVQSALVMRVGILRDRFEFATECFRDLWLAVRMRRPAAHVKELTARAEMAIAALASDEVPERFGT